MQGMPHATPVDPGTAEDQCGTTGTYFKDTICSSYRIAVFWGLTTAPPPGPTTTPPPPGATCTTASNYAHVQAGRATSSGGYVYARGSKALGLYNTCVRHTLRESPASYYTVADAGCP